MGSVRPGRMTSPRPAGVIGGAAPRRMVALLRAYGLLVTVLVLTGAVVGFAANRKLAATPAYRATGTVRVLGQVATGITGLPVTAADEVSTDAALMTEAPLLGRVITDLQLPMRLEDLQREVAVTPESKGELVDVTVVDAVPSRAALIANRLMEDFTAQVSDQVKARAFKKSTAYEIEGDRLVQALHDAQARLLAAQQAGRDLTGPSRDVETTTSLLAQERALYSGFLVGVGNAVDDLVVVTAPASVPAQPLPRATVTHVLLGVLGGLAVALGIVLLLERVDPRLRDADDVRERLGLPTVGAIPAPPRPRSRDHGLRSGAAMTPAAAEAFGRLRANLLGSPWAASCTSLVVTSASPSEGSSLIAARLAEALARAGRRVVLVDADMRTPAQHHHFDKPLEPGLAEHLACPDRGRPPALVAHPTSTANLTVVTAGRAPDDPAGLLASRRLRTLVGALERRHDVVVIDAPAVAPVPDTLSVAACASATLLVVVADRTGVSPAMRAVDALRGAGGSVLGVILDRASGSVLTDVAGSAVVDGDGEPAGWAANRPPRPVAGPLAPYEAVGRDGTNGRPDPEMSPPPAARP
ncbi:MAG: tyrosine-protein kinase [Chloroflexota bacterium]|nr:tyrosine-protein kinase [Chloroflexota bacterium]